MNRRRFVVLVLAAVVVLSGALFLAARRNPVTEPHGSDLFPGLGNEITTVTAVTLRKSGAVPATSLHKTGDRWTVAERDDYPADVGRLRQLLSAVRDAKIVEEKTSDPARYGVLGVEDLPAPAAATNAAAAPAANAPESPGVDAAAAGTEIVIATPGVTHTLIVGKAAGTGNFVRRAGEARSYSVEPGISVETEPQHWIDPHLIDVPTARIQSMEFKPPGAAAYTVRRTAAGDATFALEGAPAGRKPLDPTALAPAPSTLAALEAQDVAPAGSVDFGPGFRTVVTQTDGEVITLTGVVNGDKHWLQFQSSKAPAAAQTRGRAFEVASYRYDAIFKPLEELLVAKEPTTKPGAGAGARVGAASGAAAGAASRIPAARHGSGRGNAPHGSAQP